MELGRGARTLSYRRTRTKGGQGVCRKTLVSRRHYDAGESSHRKSIPNAPALMVSTVSTADASTDGCFLSDTFPEPLPFFL